MLGLATFVAVYFSLSGWFLWTAYRMLHGALKGGEQAVIRFYCCLCAAFLAVFHVEGSVLHQASLRN